MAVKRSAQQNPAEGNDDRPRLEASRTQIRWLIRRDMDDVLAIERASFQFPWTEEEFLCCLRQRNCIGTVAELDHRDRKSTRLNSSHIPLSRMPSSA